MKQFKFLQKEQSDISIPDFVTSETDILLYRMGYEHASEGQLRHCTFRDGLLEHSQDVFDIGYYQYFNDRPNLVEPFN